MSLSKLTYIIYLFLAGGLSCRHSVERRFEIDCLHDYIAVFLVNLAASDRTDSLKPHRPTISIACSTPYIVASHPSPHFTYLSPDLTNFALWATRFQ